MRATDPNAAAVMRRNAATIVFGLVIVVVVIAVGWALGKTAWRSAGGVTTALVDQSTDPGEAGRLVDQGERVLRNRKSNTIDETALAGGDDIANLEARGRISPEAEQRLQETRLRLEEERRRLDDLAREADHSPLGEGLHQIGNWAGRQSAGNVFRDAESPQPREQEPQSLSVSGGASGEWPEVSASNKNFGEPAPEEMADSVNVGGHDRRDGGVSFATRNPNSADRGYPLHQLFAGTVIPAVLLTNLDSGSPGTARAQVMSDVRDSVTGKHVVIPRGTLLFGRQGSVRDVHADRVSIAWTELQFPNGAVVSPTSAVASDLSGRTGISGTRESRFAKSLGAAFAINLVGGIVRGKEDDDDRLVGALRRAAGDTSVTISEQLLARDLNQPPAIRIASGTPMNVTLETPLWLPAQ